MATNWVKQHTKAMMFTVLAVLLIGGVWVYARESVHGYNDNVYWDVTVDSLYKSGNYTYSTHQYYIENDSDVAAILIEQEFKHRVMQTFPGEQGKADRERIERQNGDMSHTVTIPKGKSKRRTYRHKVDISELEEGIYYIDAYTRINLDDIAEDPTPKAKENTKSTPFMVDYRII